mmetsp:Transcript_30148/g.71843  ORF Transcript_30148/g.71843 Transcript_30148/m.71843 type:complete len:376 (+) Transcript_30148:1165-2292(+)
MTGALLFNAWGLQPWNGNRVCNQDRVHITVCPERLAMDSEPIYCLFQAFIKFDGLLPSQQLQLLQIKEVAHVVERSVAHMFDHLLRLHIRLHHGDNLFHDVDDRVLLGGPNVVGAPGDPLVQDDVKSGCHVLNVQVRALAQTISMHRELLVPFQHHDHFGNQLFRVLAWAVDVVATGDQDGQSVGPVVAFHHHLCSGLRGCVRVRRIQRRGSLNLHVPFIVVTSVLAVHLISANMDVSLYLMLHLLQHLQNSVSAQDIVIREGHRVAKGEVHMRLCREVHHCVDVLLLDDVMEQVRALDVSFHELEVGLALHGVEVLCVRAIVQPVQDDNLVLWIGKEQVLCYVACNEASSACHEYVPRLVNHLRHCSKVLLSNS